MTYFTARIFDRIGLDWRGRGEVDNILLSPAEIGRSRVDPSKARAVPGWLHVIDVDGVIDHICDAARDKVSHRQSRN